MLLEALPHAAVTYSSDAPLDHATAGGGKEGATRLGEGARVRQSFNACKKQKKEDGNKSAIATLSKTPCTACKATSAPTRAPIKHNMNCTTQMTPRVPAPPPSRAARSARFSRLSAHAPSRGSMLTGCSSSSARPSSLPEAAQSTRKIGNLDATMSCMGPHRTASVDASSSADKTSPRTCTAKQGEARAAGSCSRRGSRRCATSGHSSLFLPAPTSPMKPALANQPGVSS